MEYLRLVQSPGHGVAAAPLVPDPGRCPCRQLPREPDPGLPAHGGDRGHRRRWPALGPGMRPPTDGPGALSPTTPAWRPSSASTAGGSRSSTFGLAGALAGLSGLLIVAQYGGLGFASGFQFGLKALIAAIIGGIGSVPGALLGGIAVGLFETLLVGLPADRGPRHRALRGPCRLPDLPAGRISRSSRRNSPTGLTPVRGICIIGSRHVRPSGSGSRKRH